jgi:hypothetical protein
MFCLFSPAWGSPEFFFNPDSFNSSCHFNIYGCLLDISDDNGNDVSDMGIIHSDFLNLFVATSLLPVPSVGKGVFARSDIPAGSLLAICRGPVTWNTNVASSNRDSHYISFEDQTFYFRFADGICQYINDIVDLSAFPVGSFEKDLDMPLMPGFSYNSEQMQMGAVDCIMVARRDIPAGAEIFHSFGK